jgi:hypothetical protein
MTEKTLIDRRLTPAFTGSGARAAARIQLITIFPGMSYGRPIHKKSIRTGEIRQTERRKEAQEPFSAHRLTEFDYDFIRPAHDGRPGGRPP